MLFKISIQYYITVNFSLFFFVKRYAVRNVKKRQYAVRRVKIRQYAVRKGEGGVTLSFTQNLTQRVIYIVSRGRRPHSASAKKHTRHKVTHIDNKKNRFSKKNLFKWSGVPLNLTD